MSRKLLLVAMTAAAYIGTFLGMALPCAHRRRAPAHDTKLRVHVVHKALAHFRSQHAVCPRSLAALPDLLAPPFDGWEQPLLFVCPGVHDPAGADVTSAGRDGLFGTADDINSWEL